MISAYLPARPIQQPQVQLKTHSKKPIVASPLPTLAWHCTFVNDRSFVERQWCQPCVASHKARLPLASTSRTRLTSTPFAELRSSPFLFSSLLRCNTFVHRSVLALLRRQSSRRRFWIQVRRCSKDLPETGSEPQSQARRTVRCIAWKQPTSFASKISRRFCLVVDGDPFRTCLTKNSTPQN